MLVPTGMLVNVNVPSTAEVVPTRGEPDACAQLSHDTLDVKAGQSVITRAGEWVQYSTPDPNGAEYIAVCLPAFSPQTVHRDP